MALTLNMSMSYVGPGDYENTSKILVLIDVSWDAVHYNRDGGELTLTVDGVTIKTKAPFNAYETSSGSENIYGSHWNVAHTSGTTKVVYATASFQATDATFVGPVNASMQLSASGGSSGGSGGGSGGDSGGGNTGGGSTGGDTGGGSSGGTTTPVYRPDTFSGNVSILGLVTVTSQTSGTLTYGTSGAGFANGKVAIVKFLTPNFAGASTHMSLRFSVENTSASDVIYYAVCSSDENYSLYCSGQTSVNDPNQIISRSAYFDFCGDGRKFSINTDKFKKNTVYYLMLWVPSGDRYSYSLGKSSYHGFTLHSLSNAGQTTLDGFADGDFEDSNYRLNSDYSVYLWVHEGEGSRITVTRTYIHEKYSTEQTTGELTNYIEVQDKFGTWRKYKIWHMDSITVSVECDDGYALNTYTVNDFELNYGLVNLQYDGKLDDEYLWCTNFANYQKEPRIYTTTVKLPKETVSIEDEEEQEPGEYMCYICTELTRQPRTLSCEISGSLYFSSDNYGTVIYTPYEDGYKNNYEGSWGCEWGGENYTRYYVYSLKFVTPHFDGTGTNIMLQISVGPKDNYSTDSDTDALINYALCTSDANRESYLRTVGMPSDEYRIASGTFIEKMYAINTIIIDEVDILPDTEYYLIVWDAQDDDESMATRVDYAVNHAAFVSYIDPNDPPIYLEYVPYIAYIDNGTTWETL